MPHNSDIHSAFVTAKQLNPKGYRCLRTEDFIRELAKVHWHFSRADANEWIKYYQPDFTDKTTDHSDNRYWIIRNMGGFCNGLSISGS